MDFVCLNLVTELGLQIAEFLLQNAEGRHDDRLGLQRATGLDIQEELVRLVRDVKVGLVCGEN